MKNIKIIVLSFLMILMCGCGVDSIKVVNPISEEELVNYVQSEIYKETGDETIVSIINKKDLNVCTSWFDTCIKYQTVENGYSYEVEIKNKYNNEIVGTGNYSDGYVKYDDQFVNGKKEMVFSFTNNYEEQKGLFLIKDEFTSLLNKEFSKFYLFKDVSNDTGYDIFINSSDYDKINNLISNLNNIVMRYEDYAYASFSIYIYKDEDIFNSTNFELYKNGKSSHGGQSYGKDMIEQYTGLEVTRIGGSVGFDLELFNSNGASAAYKDEEYVDYKTFNYLVFWYYGDSMQIFGVR